MNDHTIPYAVLYCIVLQNFLCNRTTRECVHLVMHVHFRSRDKVGGYTIQFAIPENSMLHANIVGGPDLD